MKELPRPEDLNPKRNKILDMLKKPEVKLLAFPAIEYSRKTQFSGMIEEMHRMFRGKGQYRDFETLHGEFAPKNVFGTEQLPFLLAFGFSAYSVFVPDFMESEELSDFRESVAREGLNLSTVIARKSGKNWSYELVEE